MSILWFTLYHLIVRNGESKISPWNVFAPIWTISADIWQLAIDRPMPTDIGLSLTDSQMWAVIWLVMFILVPSNIANSIFSQMFRSTGFCVDEHTLWLWRHEVDGHNVAHWRPVVAWRLYTWRWLLLCYRWRRSNQSGWTVTQNTPGSPGYTSWATSQEKIIQWRIDWQSLQQTKQS